MMVTLSSSDAVSFMSADPNGDKLLRCAWVLAVCNGGAEHRAARGCVGVAERNGIWMTEGLGGSNGRFWPEALRAAS